MQEIEHYIFEQNHHREHWTTGDTPEGIGQMLLAEVHELLESIQESYITGDVFSVASELGDVNYLVIRLAQFLGITIEDATMMKIVRNSRKYDDFTMSNGRDADEARTVAKDSWKAQGGDSLFSRVYLDHLAHD